tara:strand:+ start:34399 stop:35730 length:1332 start_codon:yes stop_codon:yes gene_type:complete
MIDAPAPDTAHATECDLAIVGAGLAGGLIALAMTAKRPEVRVLLIDGADRAGGNHIWSFFDSDISVKARILLEPLITSRWPAGHEVRFPAYGREIYAGYNSISSLAFNTHLQEVLQKRLMLGDAVTAIAPNEIRLDSGRIVHTRATIDARGISPHFFFVSSGTKGSGAQLDPRDLTAYPSSGGYNVNDPASPDAGSFLSDASALALECGWQKFVGQTLRLAAPHNIERPVIMDARVDQSDGYRFVYVLPQDAHRIFVEDTYYTDGPQLDVPIIRQRIADYAAAQGWIIEAVEHEETGVLPVTKGGNFARFWPADDVVARAGVRAGLFHPTTGYSLPFAAEFALALADKGIVDSATLARWSRAWAKRHWRSGGYYRLLGRMLFDAAPPDQRYRIFERFYRLPAPLIARFYAGQSTLTDKIRILCGRPPVRIRAAMQALMKRKRA